MKAKKLFLILGLLALAISCFTKSTLPLYIYGILCILGALIATIAYLRGNRKPRYDKLPPRLDEYEPTFEQRIMSGSFLKDREKQ